MSNAHEDSYITNPQATSLEIWKSTEGRSWKKTTPRVPRGKTRKDANRSQKNTVIPVTKALGTGTLCWLSMDPIDSENTSCSTKKNTGLDGLNEGLSPRQNSETPSINPQEKSLARQPRMWIQCQLDFPQVLHAIHDPAPYHAG